MREGGGGVPVAESCGHEGARARRANEVFKMVQGGGVVRCMVLDWGENWGASGGEGGRMARIGRCKICGGMGRGSKHEKEP